MQDSDKSKKIIIGILAGLLVVSVSYAGWATWQYIQERELVEDRIDSAVEEARRDQQAIADEQFEQELQNPFRSYIAPSVFGTIEIQFPQNWNVFVEDTTSGTEQVNLYIHPDQVRMHDEDSPYAFRMQLVDNLFDRVTRGYRRDVDRGDMTADTIVVSEIEGVRYQGEMDSGFDGELVALPFRDKTLLLWTEGDSYRDEYDKILDNSNISH